MGAPTTLPRTAPPHEVLREVLAALDRGERVVVGSVVARRGSAPSTPGQKIALFGDGHAVGTIGGGAVERVTLAAMHVALEDLGAVPRLDTFRLGANLGMCCGGAVDVLIEPLAPAFAVLVVGAGHVGIHVAPLLAGLGFRVTLCDSREEAAVAGRLPPPFGAHGAGTPVRLVLAEHDDPEVLAALPTDVADAAVLVMTHDHQLDQDVIAWALHRGFGFVGGVGSRAKAARTRARLEAKGVAPDDVARVRMPVGVDVGARTPAEIAVAIAGELVAFRSAGDARRRAVASSEAEGEEAAEALQDGEP